MKGLYRGKRKDNGEWVCGAYIVMHHNDGRTHLHHFIIPDDSDLSFGVKVEDILVEVIPETVGQYTCKEDKNGKQISEGDILKGHYYPFYDETNDVFNYYAIVMWFETAFGLLTIKAPNATVRGISAGNVDDMSDFDSDEWEIIGNIYDNPELLGDYLELLEEE